MRVIIGTALLSAVLATGCDRFRREEAVATTVGDIMADPDRFDGKKVSVSGEVDEVWGPGALTIAGPGPDLLVLAGHDTKVTGASAAQPGDIVQVVGEVARYDRFELAGDYELAGVDWPQGDPVVLAESVLVTPSAEGRQVREEQEQLRGEEAAQVNEVEEDWRTEDRAPARAEPAPEPVSQPPRALRPEPAPRARRPTPAPTPVPARARGDRRLEDNETMLPGGNRAEREATEDLERAARMPEREVVVPEEEGVNVRITEVLDNDVFLVELEDGRRLPVRLVQPELEFGAGQEIRLRGTVQEVPDEAELRSHWGLDTREAEEIRRYPTYLRVTGVSGVSGARDEAPRQW